MKKVTLLVFGVLLSYSLAACGGGGPSDAPASLSAVNLNLIFVVSEDVAFNAPGDIDPNTANLTNKCLQRSLMMGTFLKQQVLGRQNVTKIYALEPMTHLQTIHNYPDMMALVTIQQFALLNQITLPIDITNGPLYTGNSFPISVSYAPGSVPSGVAKPLFPSVGCQGLNFDNQAGDNQALLV